MVDLGTLGGNDSTAVAVNDVGQVVGGSATANIRFRAFSWTQAGGMVDLGTLGGPEARATALNNSGRVVGSSFTSGFQSHATLWLPSADTTPPKLAVSDLVVNATSPAGAVVTYVVQATDDTDPNPTVQCNPPSGSTFAIGTTTVNCTATDASGNRATASFTVRVKGAPEQLADLRHAVFGVGPGSSLADKVTLALNYLNNGNVAGACTALDAFIAQVTSQSGKSIPVATANQMVANASRVKNVIGC
jgi:probable HAF family extracellular repeat protein